MLQHSSRTSTDSRSRRSLRNMLVVVALALALLSGAGLLMRSFTKLLAFDPGLVAPGVAVAQVTLPFRKYDTPAKQAAFADAMLARYRALPGVAYVGVIDAMPLADSVNHTYIERPGHLLRPAELPVAQRYATSPDYLAASGIRLLRGRAFNIHDNTEAAPVALLSQSAADALFPGQGALGQRLHPGVGAPSRWHEVVGIVADVRHHGFTSEATPQLYVPFARAPERSMTFVLRTAGDPAAYFPSLRRELQAVDTEQPIVRFAPLIQLLSDSIAQQRFALVIFGVFSAAAFLLAALGIYGVVAYSVSRRTGEFGIRIALGAQYSDLVRLVLSQAFRLIGLGLLCGLGLALFATRFVETLLYRTPAHEPLVLASVCVLRTLVALVACILPARRAAKANPLTALRAE